MAVSQTASNMTAGLNVAMLSAIIALAGVLFSVIVSAYFSRRSIFINSVTVERSKWIEKLRSSLADFFAATAMLDAQIVHVQRPKTDEDWKQFFERSHVVLRDIDRLDALIRLQLNPEGVIDANLITLLDLVVGMMFHRELGGLTALQRLMILHSQRLLKEEWEQVKYEASGAAERWRLRAAKRKRAKEYAAFCQSEAGSFSKIVAAVIPPYKHAK